MSYTALYIDVENLLDLDKTAIRATIENWPKELPPINALKLYVKADQVSLWQIWTSHSFPSLDSSVKGVQHYTASGSKNSADIALALDMFADLMKGRVHHAALLSDDSDFVNLFAKITIEIPKTENGYHPFTWFLTNRDRTRSPILSEFLPQHYIRTIACPVKAPVPKKKASTTPTTPLTPKKVSEAQVDSFSEEKQIAFKIIEEMPVGSFKSTDCIDLIRQHFPNHSLAKLDSASFGTQFSKLIWPELEHYGVRIPNPNRKPRRYKLTDIVKKKVKQVP